MLSLLHVDAPCLLRKQFTSFAKYKSWLGKVNPSKYTACTIVEAYGHRLPELVQRIKASHVSKIDQKRAPADVILSTVHKAKGLGFPSVFMCDDLLCQCISPLIAALRVQNSLYVSDSRKLLAQMGVDVDEEVRLGDGAGPARHLVSCAALDHRDDPRTPAVRHSFTRWRCCICSFVASPEHALR